MLEGEQAYIAEISEGVLTLSFNRPDAGNAIPQAAVESLTALFRSCVGNRGGGGVGVRGEGKHFCTGGDVRAFSEILELGTAERRADFKGRLDRVNALVPAYSELEVPVVAVCRGAVAGAGLLFTLGADFVLADETVNFLFSHQRVGLTPDGGVSALLPRVIGERRASELILSAAKVDRSEQHTSDLQSLMRNSYAVFRLKKKINTNIPSHST